MLTMDIDRNHARLRIAQLDPAQIRMVELLADGHDVRYIAFRFNNATTQEIYRQIGLARKRAGVVDTDHLVKLYRAAQ